MRSQNRRFVKGYKVPWLVGILLYVIVIV